MAEVVPQGSGNVPLTLELRYRHGVGGLAPYFAGLLEGSLYAARCTGCAAVWAPPRLRCTCGSSSIEWTELSGGGVVVSATRTQSSLPATSTRGVMGFALVRFDGATNAALVRFDATHEIAAGQRVGLAPARSEECSHPVQSLCVIAAAS